MVRVATICAVDGCTVPVECVGLCPSHYRRKRRYGIPTAGRKVSRRDQPPIERFWARVDRNGPVPVQRPDLGPCWIWTAGRTGSGYGAFYPGGKKQIGAHRWSYLTFVGPLPHGMVPDHLCDHKPCVNPTHLKAATNYENTMRGESPSAENKRKTECCHGHRLDGPNVRITKRGGRRCRTCARDDATKRNAAKQPRARYSPPCGTRGGYQKHRRRGQEPCGACSTAYKAVQRDYYLRSRERRPEGRAA